MIIITIDNNCITSCKGIIEKKYNSKGTVVVQRNRERGTVTGTHTHTQGEEWRDMERDTHRVMHSKIKRGGGKRKEGEDD